MAANVLSEKYQIQWYVENAPGDTRPSAVPESAIVQEPTRAAAGDPGGTLADRVRRAAIDRPDQPALIDADRTVTWSQLDRMVDEAAAALHALVDAPEPAGSPARVGIALPNSVEFAVAFFATLRAGLVALPVNPGFTAAELRHLITDSATSVLLCTSRIAGLVEDLRPALPALTAVHVGLPDRAAGPAAPDGPIAAAGRKPGRPEDLAVLFYTSGTAGRPKGAMLTHRALLANHEQVGRISPPVVGPDDTLLLALPFFHAYGLNSGLGAVAFHGACGVLVERFDPADALALIARHQVSLLVGVPSMFLGWSLLAGAGDAMTSVRVAVSGAAPLETATASRFTEVTRHPVLVGYGLTETAPVLTSTLASPVPKAGSIGRPIPGVELRLVGRAGEELWRGGSAAQDLGDSAGDGGGSAGAAPGGADPVASDDADWELDLEGPGTDPGEIVVRGANLFSGYWPDGLGGPDADGWWATGDIAYADADGDLFLVDRLGELILVNGFNVYPHEVELVLDAHPGVAESAVIGIPHPYTGETVRAYVVRAAGADLGTGELLAHCERNLARFKCPTAIEFVDALPHSAIGKVRKTLLRPAPAPRSGRVETAEVPDV